MDVVVTVVAVVGVVAVIAAVAVVRAPEVGEPVAVRGVLLAEVGAGPGELQLVDAAGTGFNTWNQAIPVPINSTKTTTRIGDRRRR